MQELAVRTAVVTKATSGIGLATAKAFADEDIPPAQVAALVVEAIRDRRFWILPHPEFIDAMRARADAMAGGGRPVDP